MRYKVEYLKSLDDPNSMCRFRYVYVDTLKEAEEKAWEDADIARRYNGAAAFQIMDLYEERCVLKKQISEWARDAEQCHPGAQKNERRLAAQ